MRLHVLYFAWVRERMGIGEEAIDLPGEVTTVAALIDWLAARDERSRLALADRSRLRAAIDQDFVEMDADIRRAKEVAIFPPVTGG